MNERALCQWMNWYREKRWWIIKLFCSFLSSVFKDKYSFRLARRLTCVTVSAGLLGLFLLVSLALAGAQALTPAHYLSLSDVSRLQNLLSQQFTDLESAYYSVVGLTKLGATVPDQDVRKSLNYAVSSYKTRGFSKYTFGHTHSDI